MLKRAAALILALTLCGLLLPARATGEGVRAALLVGMDTFVSYSRLNPAAANNMAVLSQALASAGEPVGVTLAYGSPQEPREDCQVYPEGVLTAEDLKAAMEMAFAGVGEGDTVLLYLCTHGVWEEDRCGLVLSDGITETLLTPRELAGLIEPWQGRILVILDACHSGAFIGRGTGESLHPFGENSVLTSCLAGEDSWYWQDSSGGAQGSFYFTRQLAAGIGPGCPADENRDGLVYLSELTSWLWKVFGVSTPQFSGKDQVLIASGGESSGACIRDVLITDASPGIFELSFTVTRPVCVAYQLVPRGENGWNFAAAAILYDREETVPGLEGLAGAVDTGRKTRTLDLTGLNTDYALLQLITLEEGEITVHTSSLLSFEGEDPQIQVQAEKIREDFYCLTISHSSPCRLTVSLTDEEGQEVQRILTAVSTRPGTESGMEVCFSASGEGCRVRVKALWNGGTETAETVLP